MMGPFDWPFIYAPTLPLSALGLLEAPSPYLVGIGIREHTEGFKRLHI